MSYRQAVLQGTHAAQRLHRKLDTELEHARTNSGSIDVFSVIHRMGVALLFQPLSGLLGAFLSEEVCGAAGILVTTARELHTQRFTAAHELGHMILDHTPSLDTDIGLWRGSRHANDQETAADAFASEFVLPRWLYVHHARRKKWNSAALRVPQNAYQLSLRCGASYEATCWGLKSHNILDRSAVDRLRATAPKLLKREALAARTQLENPWANVWIVDEADNGLLLETTPDDVLVLRLVERPSAGYIWDLAAPVKDSWLVLDDSYLEPPRPLVGEPLVRQIAVRASTPGRHRLELKQRRPFGSDAHRDTFTLRVDALGKEKGLPRVARRSAA